MASKDQPNASDRGNDQSNVYRKRAERRPEIVKRRREQRRDPDRGAVDEHHCLLIPSLHSSPTCGLRAMLESSQEASRQVRAWI